MNYQKIESCSLANGTGWRVVLWVSGCEHHCPGCHNADLWDDMSVMKEMVKKYNEGNEIVYGVRNNRDSDSFFKRKSAESFYKLMNNMGVQTVYNHADYRLLSKRVLNELENYKEVNLFLRGMIPLVGFESCSVYYSRQERLAGESHYPLKKMMDLAIDGITSLSVKPLTLIFTFGAVVSLASLVALIVMICMKQTMYALLLMNSLLLGILIMSVGVVGQYVGKTYVEVKQRPRFIISERTYKDGE